MANARIFREYAGGSVGGILRKTAPVITANDTSKVELLVFGYACKIYRDDEKARDIDQGKHLIPWMGDNNHKIDRYDVRGILNDLTIYEPPTGGYGNRLDYLNAEEQRAELLCEEERYLYLYNNEEEHILQQEEELKRFNQEAINGGSIYNQVEFQYCDDNVSGVGGGANSGIVGIQHGPNASAGIDRNSPNCDEGGEQPYTPPASLFIPPSIQLPDNMKQHAIIEKTARFIASQGAQMEILLKAKQSNNVQFEFLTQNSLLNPYYKFVMNAIKEGTYPAPTVAATATAQDLNQEKTNVGTESGNQNDASSGFSFSSTGGYMPQKSVVTVPTIKYKPSADCAYTQLISKIKGVPLPDVLEENANSPNATTNSSLQAADSPGTPVLLQYNGATFITAEENSSNSNNTNSMPSACSTGERDQQSLSSQVEILQNSSALALAQDYASDTEDEEETKDENKANADDNDADDDESGENSKEEKKAECAKKAVTERNLDNLKFPIPMENLKNIIDKTAIYVIKNGRQFEETLRAKNDERFTFLQTENEFYPYYLYQITGDPDAASIEQKQKKAQAVAAALISRKGLNVDKGVVAPVSFSIKTNETHPLPPALSQEPSDDEADKLEYNNGNTQKSSNIVNQQQQHQPPQQQQHLQQQQNQHQRGMPEQVQKAIQLVEHQLMARNAAQIGSLIAPHHLIGNMRSHLSQTRAETERNAAFEQQQQNRQKEMRKAEEKVRDKLTQIAREKLGGLITKEKQLQLERKKKALAFLKNQIAKGNSPSTSTNFEPTPTVSNNTVNNENETGNDGYNSDESQTSVRSIPITFYGPEDDDDEMEDKTINALYDVSGLNTVNSPPPPLPPPPPQSQQKLLQKSKHPTQVVMLSDDDDVQLVSETKAPRYNKMLMSHDQISTLPAYIESRTLENTMKYNYTNKLQHYEEEEQPEKGEEEKRSTSAERNQSERRDYRTKSRSHSHHSRSRRTRTRSRSRSHSHSRSRSRSHSHSKSKHAERYSKSRSKSKSSRHHKKKSKKRQRSRSPSSATRRHNERQQSVNNIRNTDTTKQQQNHGYSSRSRSVSVDSFDSTASSHKRHRRHRHDHHQRQEQNRRKRHDSDSSSSSSESPTPSKRRKEKKHRR